MLESIMLPSSTASLQRSETMRNFNAKTNEMTATTFTDTGTNCFKFTSAVVVVVVMVMMVGGVGSFGVWVVRLPTRDESSAKHSPKSFIYFAVVL